MIDGIATRGTIFEDVNLNQDVNKVFSIRRFFFVDIFMIIHDQTSFYKQNLF